MLCSDLGNCIVYNVHHAKWLNHSTITDVKGIQSLNFSIAQSLIQIVNFPTRFPNNSDQQVSSLDLFLISTHGSCEASQLSSVESVLLTFL